MGHIFISYSKKDKKYARKLADDLLRRGFDVWIDDRIDHGDQWWNAIEKAIEDCDAIITIMSPNSQQSKWVQREILYADTLNKPALPLLLENPPFPIYGNIQHDDVTNRRVPSTDFYVRLSKISPPKSSSGSFTDSLPEKRRLSIPRLNEAWVIIFAAIMTGIFVLIGVFLADKLTTDNGEDETPPPTSLTVSISKIWHTDFEPPCQIGIHVETNRPVEGALFVDNSAISPDSYEPLSFPSDVTVTLGGTDPQYYDHQIWAVAEGVSSEVINVRCDTPSTTLSGSTTIGQPLQMHSISYTDDPRSDHFAQYGQNSVISFDGDDSWFRICRGDVECTEFAISAGNPAVFGGFDYLFEKGVDGQEFTAFERESGNNVSCIVFITSTGYHYCGVPIPDSDGDGVNDYNDECPTDPDCPIPDLTLIAGTDALTLMVLSDAPASLRALEFQVIINGQVQRFVLNELFDSLILSDDTVQPNDCFVLETQDSNYPVPFGCDTIYRHSISDTNVFWYDQRRRVGRAIGILNGESQIAICPSSTYGCEFYYYAAPLTNTPTVTPN